MTNYPKIPFTEIATLIRGVSYDKSVALLAPKDGFLPILRANNIQKDLILNDLVYVPSDLVKEEQMIREGDIVLAMSSGSKDLVGKSAQADKDINAAFGIFCGLIRAKENIDSKFLGLYFQTQEYRNFVSYQSKGVNICNLKKKDIESLQIPLPPLPTQRAIVTRIESLFAELDKGVEHLRTAQQQIKTYKQAVLRDAFEGCKEMKTVLELSTIVTSGSRGWAKYYTDKEDARFVRITDLTRDNIILQNKNIQYISLPPNAEGKRSLLQPNDVLVSITADLGSIALVPQNIGEAYINQHIAMIRFKNTKLGKFMAYYLKSDFGQKELLKNKRGNGKLGLGLDDIRNTYIPMVEEEAASDIVNKIDSRLSQAEAAETRIAESLQKTEVLRQSILKKAFSGELVQVDL